MSLRDSCYGSMSQKIEIGVEAKLNSQVAEQRAKKLDMVLGVYGRVI
jgi:hypothetical protein